MKAAIYPGSFDPVTNGHLDIVERAAKLFDKLYVAVLINPEKHTLFSVEERVSLLKATTAQYPNVEVVSFGGLLAQYARDKGIKVIVKGLRALSDFEYEFQMALTNKSLNPELETIFLTTSAENMYLSSSVVRQVSGFGGEVTKFVPDCVSKALNDKLKMEDEKA
ncbi:MAG: pantetheine-phosphate adenylyltransferase [Clostridia bacterium]|nr:pantetheine-phosphate adenylyltransferase [Clostridia bacterium]